MSGNVEIAYQLHISLLCESWLGILAGLSSYRCTLGPRKVSHSCRRGVLVHWVQNCRKDTLGIVRKDGDTSQPSVEWQKLQSDHVTSAILPFMFVYHIVYLKSHYILISSIFVKKPPVRKSAEFSNPWLGFRGCLLGLGYSNSSLSWNAARVPKAQAALCETMTGY